MNLSDNQKNLLKEALNKIREAQMECENHDHPFYKFCDEQMYPLQDVLDEDGDLE